MYNIANVTCIFTFILQCRNVVQITKLKIDSNPFAKGFRDSSRLCDFDRFCRVL